MTSTLPSRPAVLVLTPEELVSLHTALGDLAVLGLDIRTDARAAALAPILQALEPLRHKITQLRQAPTPEPGIPALVVACRQLGHLAEGHPEALPDAALSFSASLLEQLTSIMSPEARAAWRIVFTELLQPTAATQAAGDEGERPLSARQEGSTAEEVEALTQDAVAWVRDQGRGADEAQIRASLMEVVGLPLWPQIRAALPASPVELLRALRRAVEKQIAGPEAATQAVEEGERPAVLVLALRGLLEDWNRQARELEAAEDRSRHTPERRQMQAKALVYRTCAHAVTRVLVGERPKAADEEQRRKRERLAMLPDPIRRVVISRPSGTWPELTAACEAAGIPWAYQGRAVDGTEHDAGPARAGDVWFCCWPAGPDEAAREAVRQAGGVLWARPCELLARLRAQREVPAPQMRAARDTGIGHATAAGETSQEAETLLARLAAGPEGA